LAYSYTLGQNIDMDNISSECENGLLTIYLPKIDQYKPVKGKKIEVK
jgi:HSP20 family molecular chaperone IbpA